MEEKNHKNSMKTVTEFDSRQKIMKLNKLKEIIHPLLLKLMSVKTTGELIVKGSLPEDENCLIVANHLCIEDIPTLAQAVQKHFYLLVSDEDKNTIDGLGLKMNGVQWVHRLDKNSRIDSSNNAIFILKNNKNFAMYPEATWNLSPNMLIMPMNYGCIRIALEANVPIVPVVSFFSNDVRQTIIGNKFYPTEDLEESINLLRDIMSTMVYEQIQDNYRNNYGKPGIYCMEVDGQKYYYEKSSEIPCDYWERYIDEKYEEYKRAKKNKNGVREFESQFIFTPKGDDYTFFQIFNSVIKEVDGKILIKRISSEKNGVQNSNYRENFEYGYNEKILKNQLKK